MKLSLTTLPPLLLAMILIAGLAPAHVTDACAADTLIVNLPAGEEEQDASEYSETNASQARDEVESLADRIIKSNSTKKEPIKRQKAEPKPEPKPKPKPAPEPKQPDPFKARTVRLESPAAYVQAVDGEAWAFHDFSQYRPLALKSPIYSGESVETSPNGAVRIVFLDGSILEIKANGHADVEHYSYSPGGGARNSLALTLNKGAFRMATGRITKSNPNGLTVRGPVSTLVATEGEIASLVTGEHDLHALINGLPIIVRNRSGSVRSVDRQDYALTVRRGLKTLSAPAMLTNEQKALLYEQRFMNEVGWRKMAEVLKGKGEAHQDTEPGTGQIAPKAAKPVVKSKKPVKGGPVRLKQMPKVKQQPAPKRRKRLQDMTPAERERFLSKGAGQ